MVVLNVFSWREFSFLIGQSPLLFHVMTSLSSVFFCLTCVNQCLITPEKPDHIHMLIFWLKPCGGLSWILTKSSLPCGKVQSSLWHTENLMTPLTFCIPDCQILAIHTSAFAPVALFLEPFPQGRPGGHLIHFKDSAVRSEVVQFLSFLPIPHLHPREWTKSYKHFSVTSLCRWMYISPWGVPSSLNLHCMKVGTMGFQFAVISIYTLGIS